MEETSLPDEDAPDGWVLTRADRLLTVASYPTSHLLQICHSVRLPEELPSLGDTERDEIAVEATPHDSVMRVMSLEERTVLLQPGP